jgi:hypothetical protein
MTTLDNENHRAGKRRRAAAAYVRETYGVPCSVNYLAKLAVSGEGPPFRYYGRYPIYDELDLDAYVQSKMSAKTHSTSGRPPRDGVHRGRPRNERRAEAEARASKQATSGQVA